jgi:hypothetical protein
MKKIIAFLLLFSAFSLFAQSPALINYQAVVRDANGNLITSGTISLGISIHDAIVGGNQLYFETHNGITPNAFGVVNVLIGGGTVISGNFLLINWGNGNKYLQVYVNSNPIGSRTQMVSVPYALYANKADSSNYAAAALKATTADTATNLKNAPVIITGWENYLIAQEERPNYVAVGAAIPNTFQIRVLNKTRKLVGNAISHDSVAGTITLNQAGTYLLRASAPTMQGRKCQLVIRNTSTNVILLYGTNSWSDIGNQYADGVSTVEGAITVSGVTTIKLDHFIEYSINSGARGAENSPGSGIIGVFSRCFVQKIQ